MKTNKPTKTASASETRIHPPRVSKVKGKSLILDHELIEDARIEARLDAIYDREEREGGLYRDE